MKNHIALKNPNHSQGDFKPDNTGIHYVNGVQRFHGLPVWSNQYMAHFQRPQGVVAQGSQALRAQPPPLNAAPSTTYNGPISPFTGYNPPPKCNNRREPAPRTAPPTTQISTLIKATLQYHLLNPICSGPWQRGSWQMGVIKRE